VVDAISALPGVRLGRSQVSDPRSIAFHLDSASVEAGRDEAPLGGEFAHVHPFDGGSQHLVLPPAWGTHLIEQGWAEPHPIAKRLPAPVLFMVYGPRDADETDTVIEITKAAYAHVRGLDPDALDT
jgi:phospholipase/carboxylesterase